jgi:hypothetical protein
MKFRRIVLWIALALVFSAGLVLFVYRIARLPLWIALLFPLFSCLAYGLLNVIGTWLGHRKSEIAGRST